jgi:hydrogenase maturation protein HypF
MTATASRVHDDPRSQPVDVRGADRLDPVEWPLDSPPLVATGVDRGGAFALVRGTTAWLRAPAGDVGTLPPMEAYLARLTRSLVTLEMEPEVIAHDARPDQATTRLAFEMAADRGARRVAVSHHHAHHVAVMAEHGLSGAAIGLVLDAPWPGPDGMEWGGEVLTGGWTGVERLGHLRAVAVPDVPADRAPAVRAALAYAADAGVLAQALKVMRVSAATARRILGTGGLPEGAPFTTSGGRLFEAMVGLSGLWRSVPGGDAVWTRAGHGANPSSTHEYAFDLDAAAAPMVLDLRPTIAAMVLDLARGRPGPDAAGRFHRSLAAGLLAISRLTRGRTGLNKICLSGEVLANDLLASDLSARLRACDFEVYMPRLVPPGEQGLALGQALAAGALPKAG